MISRLQPLQSFHLSTLLKETEKGRLSQTSGDAPGNKSCSEGIVRDWHQQEFLSRLCQKVDWAFSSTEKRGSHWASYLPREPVLKILNGLYVRGGLWGWSNPPLAPQGGGYCRPQSRTCRLTDKPSVCGGTRPAVAEAPAGPLPPPSPQNKGRSFSAPPRVQGTHTPSITIKSRIRNAT